MPPRPKGPRLVTRKGKENYYIRYTDAKTGKPRDKTTGTADGEQAQEELEDFLREQRSQRLGLAIMPHRITVAQIMMDFDHYVQGEEAAKRFGYSLRHIVDFWGDSTLDYVNVETVKEYVNKATNATDPKQRRTVSTTRRELTDLRTAINHAIRMNRVAAFRFPKLPSEGQPKERWLTESEFARLLCSARKVVLSRFPLTLFMIVAFYSGQRKSAIMELEWSQIDFDRRTINFEKDGRRRTKKRRSFIPMPREMERVLRRRHDRYAHLTNWVFHQKHQPAVRVRSVDKGFRVAARSAGLLDVTPHTLRHTRASLSAQSGQKMQDVSAYLNMSHQTLERVYLHHDPNHL